MPPAPGSQRFRWKPLALAFAAALAAAPGQESAGPLPVDFVRDVQPIFEARCHSCHAGERAKSGFRLDARSRALRGGNSGEPAIVPGHPGRSLLLRLVRGEREGEVMPPKGRPLDAAEIAVLERWIAGGAKWPDAASGEELVKEHWAFVKPARPEPPPVARPERVRNPIDAFVLARLDAEGLEPSPEADRWTLARRLALDLTGIPPSREDSEALAADASDAAYGRFVDRLLASPAFGERWAALWLDLARYADSMGYGSDPLRPWMWRWREWVIDAFNRNVPWDRFTVEQIAGDLLPGATTEQRLATAFHRQTMNNTEGGTDNEEFRIAAVKDRAETTAQVWLGLTLGCAECHSHKFDPIPHKDYYRFCAFFDQTEDADTNDDAPRLPTPTPEEARELEDLRARIAGVGVRRAAAATALAGSQEGFEEDVRARERRWIPLRPSLAASKAGAELRAGDDGTVAVLGGDAAADTYVLEATTPSGHVTGVRLEALPDPALPGGGPGRSEGNGNFVLTEIRVEAAPAARVKMTGRFVRLELPGRKRILSVAEVQAFAAGRNVAAAGRASQASTDYDGPAELAIDGVTDGDYRKAKSTTHTREGDDPWWELDLGAETALDRLAIWNRTDGGLQKRLAGLEITVLGSDREPRFAARYPEAPASRLEIDLREPAPAKIRRARASHEQEKFGAASAIDGDSGAATGWAVGGRQGRRNVAVFELEQPAGGPGGTRLRITLAQRYGGGHTLGRFRLSVWSGGMPPPPPPPTPPDVEAALAKPAETRTDAEREALRAFRESEAPELAPFNLERAALEKSLADLEARVVRTPVLRELPPENRRRTHVLVKGNHLVRGDEVSAATPAAFPPLPDGAPRDRLALARWLVHPDHPLTARVAVNRFWARLFGRGLVETEEDFGTQGSPPSHPELLDWLATEFVRLGWDVKALLRMIVSSTTYRQSSAMTARHRERDPRNALLARQSRRRLEGEMVRDQALAVAGLLSRRIGGPSVYPPQPEGLWQAAFNGDRAYPTSTGEDRHRRALYTFWRRTSPPPAMQAFDAPSRESCTLRRQATNTPLQAFVTLNDPVFVEAAQAFARRILEEGGATPEERAAFALREALLRPPAPQQVRILVELHARELERARADPAAARLLAGSPPGAADPAGEAAWTVVANVVLNLDALLVRG